MWILPLIICFIFIFLLVYRWRKAKDWLKDIDKKEHMLYMLYPLSDWIITKTGLNRVLNKRDRITESIKALYLTGKPELICKLFWCKRISFILAITFLFNLIAIFGFLSSDSNSVIISGKYLIRPDYGEGSTKVDLDVILKRKDANASDGSEFPDEKDISISVNERRYTSEELNKVFQKSFEYLKIQVLGENVSADRIYESLDFCSVIPGTSIAVDWIPEDYRLIHADGTVNNENINPEGISTWVRVILNYGEEQTEQVFQFRVMPRQYSNEEILQGKLEQEIKKASEDTSTDEYLKLPESVDTYQLIWEDKKESIEPSLIFLGIIIAAAVWIIGDKELEGRMKKRKDQMLFDYPEIINKFTLLINAGMTIKQAWLKIAEDYGNISSKKGYVKRYAYEEMLTTAREMKLGVPENISYDQYGRRTGLIPYIKFSSLITQNLKKGTRGFTELLMREAIESFEDRKEAAKRLGEEAGTKLLIPMMVMLIIIFLMIMIPAFLSFRI